MREPRRRVGAYTDLGPSLSRHIMMPFGMTDRGTGIVYYLTAGSTATPPAGPEHYPRHAPGRCASGLRGGG